MQKNVNWKVIRICQHYNILEEEKQEMLVDLSTELLERDEELAEKNQEIDKLEKNLDRAIHEKLCIQKCNLITKQNEERSLLKIAPIYLIQRLMI